MFARTTARVAALGTQRGIATRAAPRHGSYALGAGAVAAVGLCLAAPTLADSRPTVYGILGEVNSRLQKIEKALGLEWVEELEAIGAVTKSNPGNLAMKHFDEAYFASLSDELKVRLIAVVRSGFENPDSGMGAYAIQPTDYDDLAPFMDAVIRDYHKVPAGKKHVNNWSLAGVEGLPADGLLDLTKLGLGETSMRVRTGRNLSKFPMPGGMTQADRVNMEATMVEAFAKLIADPAYGGEYVSLTPGHANQISEQRYQQLVKQHIMFKDMADDPYLASAGIASDWPHGRGCYISADKAFIVWVGEEDHLRIMSMKKGTHLNEVFDRLSTAIETMNTLADFAYSDTYGVVTSCPTNLGTGESPTAAACPPPPAAACCRLLPAAAGCAGVSAERARRRI